MRTAFVGGLVVLVAVVLLVVWRWPDNRSRAVPVDEVVRNYRASTVPFESGPLASPPPTRPPSDGTTPASSSATSPTRPITNSAPHRAEVTTTTSVPMMLTLPATGVYRYATDGWEEVDALNGARHDYPTETTITITADGCGVRLRWDALRERRDEWRLCSTDLGIELQPDAIQYHEFFQQPELEHIDCDRGVVVVPAGEASTEPVTQSCHLGDDPWMATWSVIERSTRPVAGADVGVWHVRMSVDDDDEFWERTTIDWFFDDHGLPVAMTSTKESNSPSPIGDVLYRERYELSALSLTPLR
jgi:hypothetical protein